jgi:lipid-binding SYLF domain-containing protein
MPPRAMVWLSFHPRAAWLEVASFMKTLLWFGASVTVALGLGLCFGTVVSGQTGLTQPQEVWTPEAGIVDAAGDVLREIMSIPMRSIPSTLLAEARGIAIVPRLLKGAFLVGVRHGRGLVLTRDEAGEWRGPVFITLTGGSFGWQAGIQETDVILVFVTRQSIEGLLRGKFTIGADAAATAGPVGREASLATDHTLRAEIYSYSLSRGLFAGVALDGSVLQTDAYATHRYYAASGMTAAAVQAGQSRQLPPSAVRLLDELKRWSPARLADVPANPGPQTGNVEQQRQALQRQLVEAARRLESLLDDSWKKYLALPADVSATDRRPSPEAFRESLGRFHTVATNPAYRALAQRREFQETYALLHRLATLESNSARLALPPPPQ